FVDAEISVRSIAAAAEENLAVGGPAQGLVWGRMIGQPFRLAAGGGHDIDIVIALVLSGEGDELAVGGKLGKGLLAFVGGEPEGYAAGDRHFPQIAFGGEDNRTAADGRVTVKPVRQRLGPQAGW